MKDLNTQFSFGKEKKKVNYLLVIREIVFEFALLFDDFFHKNIIFIEKQNNGYVIEIAIYPNLSKRVQRLFEPIDEIGLA